MMSDADARFLFAVCFVVFSAAGAVAMEVSHFLSWWLS
jgi:hypothetical protein